LIIKDIDKTPRAKYLWNYVHDLLMTRFQRCAYLGQSEICELLNQACFTVTVEQIRTHCRILTFFIAARKLTKKVKLFDSNLLQKTR
jgi:hypothetical protein